MPWPVLDVLPTPSRTEQHEQELDRRCIPYKLIQELSGGWTIRLVALRAIDVAGALGAFFY